MKGGRKERTAPGRRAPPARQLASPLKHARAYTHSLIQQHAGVQYILDTMVEALLADPRRKFTYVEQVCLCLFIVFGVMCEMVVGL